MANPFDDNFKEVQEFISLPVQAEFQYPELDQPVPRYTEQEQFMCDGLGFADRMFAPVSADAPWSTLGEDSSTTPPAPEPEP